MTLCCLVSPLAHAQSFDSFAEQEESRSVGYVCQRDNVVFAR